MFYNVNSNVFACMKQKLAAEGIAVPPGSEGDMERQGVKAHIKWDGENILTIIITDKPWYVPCGKIIGLISDFVKSCGGLCY
jgi:hypothetical protein